MNSYNTIQHGGRKTLLQKTKWLIMPILIFVIICLTGIASLGQEDTAEAPVTTDEADTQKRDAAGAVRPDWQVAADNGIHYGISSKAGFLFSANAGNSWEPRNNGLPKKRIYPFTEEQVRYLTNLGVDPANSARVAVITATEIYLSENYGQNWNRVARKKPIPEGAYLTAVALSPADKNTILLGTSFAGIFESRDLGKTWINVSGDLKFLYQGSDYWEEIAAVAYQKEEPNLIIFRCGFGQGVYRMSKDRKKAEKLNLPNFITTQTLDKSQSAADSDMNAGDSQGMVTEAAADSSPMGSQLTADIGSQLYKRDIFKRGVVEDQAKAARLQKAANKYGIYVRSDKARGESLAEKIRLIKKNGLNAMVIDFKDDFGFLTYDTKLAKPREMGAVRRNPIDIKELLKKAEQNGIYVIGRIVTFQDPKLHQYQNYKYAVWDQTINKPWHTKEYWVDPFAVDVWEYNRAIAEELQSLGIDEIQFDYIRFPTDGDISKIIFRYRPAGAEKADALESFLVYAREKITIPISTDLYGFSCWCRSLSYNGQNVEMIADYVDVICPMYYPSHFPGGFLPGMDYLERARKIYNDGTSRAFSIVEGRSLVRPYVQAFRLGRELRMAPPVYTQYLLNQIQGNLATVSPGFTLWDYSNSYYMVTKPLGGLLERNQATGE
jgi:hypothetical protein